MSSFEVKLAIYDLSRGMARSLSGQLLGPQHAIDVIPHTGIVVYGLEYFFGAGIQCEDPNAFRRATGMYPFEEYTIGHTAVSQEQFEAWCAQMMLTGRYNANSYNILTRNCNNFSQDAAMQGLGLSQGVPDWILDLPRKVLSSPLGQLLRPMLDNMQLSHVDGAHTVTSQTTSQSTSPTTTTSEHQKSIPDNPWSENKSASTTAKPCIPILDSFNKPLLSKDTKMIDICEKKMNLALQDDADKEILHQASLALINDETMAPDVLEKICDLIATLMSSNQQQPNNLMCFILMFLRLVVLKTSQPATKCLEMVKEKVISSKKDQVFQNPLTRSTAWLTLSNAMATTTTTTTSPETGISPFSLTALESLVDAALTDISSGHQPRSEVRQAATAFLYNFVLSCRDDSFSNDLPDTHVSMVCGCLEGLVNEADETCRLRRVMVIGRILMPVKGDVCEMVKDLIIDLGYVDVLRTMVEQSLGNSRQTQADLLAAEIVTILTC